MYSPYNENCKACPFKGPVTEPHIGDGSNAIRYIDCQRDNEDIREHFRKTGKKEDLLQWSRQQGEFLYCLYEDKNNDEWKAKYEGN
jgi:hypothetical protein